MTFQQPRKLLATLLGQLVETRDKRKSVAASKELSREGGQGAGAGVGPLPLGLELGFPSGGRA